MVLSLHFCFDLEYTGTIHVFIAKTRIERGQIFPVCNFLWFELKRGLHRTTSHKCCSTQKVFSRPFQLTCEFLYSSAQTCSESKFRTINVLVYISDCFITDTFPASAPHHIFDTPVSELAIVLLCTP